MESVEEVLFWYKPCSLTNHIGASMQQPVNFQSRAFDPTHWLLAMGVGLLPLLAMESWKFLLPRGKSKVREQDRFEPP